MDQAALDLKFPHKVLVLDLAVSKTLWDFKQNEEKSRWFLERTPLFLEWIEGVRGTCCIRRCEISPSRVIGGELEYERTMATFRKFIGRHPDPDRQPPLGIKRWEIGFTDEMDALMFKLRWVG